MWSPASDASGLRHHRGFWDFKLCSARSEVFFIRKHQPETQKPELKHVDPFSHRSKVKGLFFSISTTSVRARIWRNACAHGLLRYRELSCSLTLMTASSSADLCWMKVRNPLAGFPLCLQTLVTSLCSLLSVKRSETLGERSQR